MDRQRLIYPWYEGGQENNFDRFRTFARINTVVLFTMPSYCQYHGCNKYAHYGIPNTKRRLYCIQHKLTHHIDVSRTHCIWEGCMKNAYYGTERGIKEYCKEHLPSNEYTRVDVCQCLHNGCNKEAYYGLPNGKKEYCRMHIPDTRYIALNYKRCIYPKCTQRASYALIGSKMREYCRTHSSPQYVNLDTPLCVLCKTIATNKIYCLRCSIIQGLASPKREPRSKEKALTKYLHDSLTDDRITRIICNRTYPTSCEETKRYRPDVKITTAWCYIIIEMDENQHKADSYSCERKRMVDIQSDHDKMCVFLRLNPDPYYVKGKRTSEPSLIDRFDVILKRINKLLTMSPDNLSRLIDESSDYVYVEYFYYDIH